MGEEVFTEEIKEYFINIVEELAEKKSESILEEKILELEEQRRLFEQSCKDEIEVIAAKKAQTIVESKMLELSEEFNEKFDEKVEMMVESMDKYLEEAKNEFISKNKVAIESELKTDIADHLVKAIIDVLSENYIEIPKGQEMVVEAMETQISLMGQEIDSFKSKIAEVEEELIESKKALIFVEATKEYTSIEKDEIMELMEGIECKNENDFSRKLKIVLRKFNEKDDEDDVIEEKFTETKKVDKSDLYEDVEIVETKFVQVDDYLPSKYKR